MIAGPARAWALSERTPRPETVPEYRFHPRYRHGRLAMGGSDPVCAGEALPSPIADTTGPSVLLPSLLSRTAPQVVA